MKRIKNIILFFLPFATNLLFAQTSIDIHSFGVRGDGKSDDTPILEKAIDYCSTTNRTLKLGGKNDIFLITKPLLLKQKIHIKGKGLLKKAPYSNFTLLTVLADGTEIEGIKMDGNRCCQNQFGVNNSELMIINSIGATIKNLDIKNSPGNAIALFNSANCKILNNKICDTQENAILIADGASNDNLIAGNYIDKTYTQNGVFLTASSGSTKTEARIFRNIVKNNIIKNSGDIGIESSIHADSSYIYSNQIYNSKNDQILIRDNISNIIENNSCYNTGDGTGIAISILGLINDTKSYNCKIVGNKVVNASNAGILAAGSGIYIQNNILSGVGSGQGIGISIQNNDITLIANKIDNFGTGIKEFIFVSIKEYKNNSIKNVVIPVQLLDSH